MENETKTETEAQPQNAVGSSDWLAGRWEVSLKGKANNTSYEIAIVHEANQHGKLSYGWNGPDKLIISTSYQNTHSLPEPVWNDLVAVAEKWAAWRTQQKAR